MAERIFTYGKVEEIIAEFPLGEFKNVDSIE